MIFKLKSDLMSPSTAFEVTHQYMKKFSLHNVSILRIMSSKHFINECGKII